MSLLLIPNNSFTVSNIALASAVSDTFGKSSAALIEYILTCDTFDSENAKTLLQRKPKNKTDEVIVSIVGYELRDNQSVKMKFCRKHFDCINECISILDEKLSDLSKPYHEFIEFASTIPGVTNKSTAYIIAEIGANMTIFKSSKHLYSWAGLPPSEQ